MSTVPEPSSSPEPQTPPPAPSEPDLLTQIVQNTGVARNEQQRATFEQGLYELAKELESGELSKSGQLSNVFSGSIEGLISSAIAQIDDRLSDQVDQIVHHPKFQKLEATWRSLERLVEGSFNRTEHGEEIKIKVLNATRRDLERDLGVGRPKTPFKTGLFEKIYTSSYNTLGGQPFGALIGDFEFSAESKDVDLLEKIAAIAAPAHAPFLAAASSEMFGWGDYTKLPGSGDIATLFNLPQYDTWRSFREKSDARYVGLCLPRVLARLPYDRGNAGGEPVELFDYAEGVDGSDHSKYLWANAAYALAGRMLEAFALDGWSSAITGPKGGGTVDDLPLAKFRTQEGDIAIKPPTEVQISDAKETSLNRLGFIPLVHRKGDRSAVFFGVPSIHDPGRYTSDGGNANAYLGSQLPYILAASRIAHYLKVMGREEVGSMPNASQIRTHFENWIYNYVIDQVDATEDQKRRKPLRRAQIEVTEIAGRPGYYEVKAFIVPHFKLEGFAGEVSLVAELPGKIGG